MKKIQILGSGCAKCQKLATVADAAARAIGLPYEIEKVTDMKQIMSFKVMSTPALVVDGQVKLSGRVPTVEEAERLLR